MTNIQQDCEICNNLEWSVGASDEGGAGASIDECRAPPEGFAWSYEAIKRDIYEQNAVCSATFALEYRGQDSLSAVVAIALDNTLIQDRLWEDHEPAPGGQWTPLANDNHLKGSSCMRVTRPLLVRDEPRCEWLLEEGREHFWESIAAAVDPPPCP